MYMRDDLVELNKMTHQVDHLRSLHTHVLFLDCFHHFFIILELVWGYSSLKSWTWRIIREGNNQFVFCIVSEVLESEGGRESEPREREIDPDKPVSLRWTCSVR